MITKELFVVFFQRRKLFLQGLDYSFSHFIINLLIEFNKRVEIIENNISIELQS
jgi:hypothetical protein